MADKIATREAYGNALAEFGEKYDFVVLDADLAEATKTGVFKKKFPDRFFDCGIAEGNMVSVAAGIATTGMNVFCSSFAMFAAGRAFEQVRNSIGYPHLNVKIGATHAGISVGEDGATHQCLEDIALMRTIPGMVIINPADAVEARAAVEWALNYKGPVYLRFGRLAVPVIFDREKYVFEMGKNTRLTRGRDVTIYASGLTVGISLDAAKLLKKEGIKARVVNVATIKPIDEAEIISSAKQTGAIVTVEEHNVIGGLGEAVCGVTAANFPVPVIRVGTNDVFGKSGKVPALLKEYGLTAENVAEKAKEALALKKKLARK
ncbi:MAG: transketolase family protein [Clostridia bacterium]|nr:transketolase family protein [Clostridia bacterium]